ncbi:polyprenyl diphosphate synthase [Amnibacterium kyonggiense]|uniref:Isoprenyl transferase n=1 Tax=Amnibacterium kyonggiense TaxID=595671 RepID=A0A4R7FGE7_9MICO|nr:polyprenyl diphosphate synthase [Amnibacterium kyonggiense]TDS76030.1 short-chain Z-isoprenyl diphosphate synthase [Amnibacterium kyonggiense]
MRGRGVRLRRPFYAVYQRRLRHNLEAGPLPKHVAMILDGNRRWAKLAGLESAEHGHRAGADKLLEFAGWVDGLRIPHVTFYLLSSDNLVGRTSGELTALFDIIGTLALDLSTRWRVQHVGTTEGLPASLLAALSTAQERGAGRSGLHINLAVGYGGRTEIAHAMRSIVTEHAAAGGTLAELTEHLDPELIAAHLYTGGQPDPDLVIRTSGEQRLSDFMLWQSAHSEFYFVEALGPDLREVDFLRALRSYAQRQRRYGA